MANLEFCDKHNMVAYLNKPTGSEGFQEIVDFLNDSYIRFTKLPQTSVPIPNVPDEAVYEEWDDRVERATTTTTSLDAEQASGCQEPWGFHCSKTRSERVPTPPHDSPLLRVNTLGSDKGSMKLQELMALCIKLSDRVLALETDLRQTKKVYGTAYTKLIMKVKKLEKTVKSNQARRRAKILVYISTAEESVSTTGVSMPVSTAGMVQEVNISFPSPVVVKDKGKGIMTESKDEQTKRTKIQLEQERLSHEAAVRLQEELDEEERQRMARVHEAA
ncbi:hypothetical protein Tco_0467652 [Tanacetum coccineum]